MTASNVLSGSQSTYPESTRVEVLLRSDPTCVHCVHSIPLSATCLQPAKTKRIPLWIWWDIMGSVYTELFSFCWASSIHLTKESHGMLACPPWRAAVKRTKMKKKRCQSWNCQWCARESHSVWRIDIKFLPSGNHVKCAKKLHIAFHKVKPDLSKFKGRKRMEKAVSKEMWSSEARLRTQGLNS